MTSLLLPYLSSSLTDSLPSLNLLCHSKTDAQFMQDAQKADWSIPYVSVAFFPNLKQNFIAYSSSKVFDSIFEIHQQWQSGFTRVYSNCCCSCSFEPEIIKISQSSHKMYSNNIMNFQESTTILNACPKKVWKLIEGTTYIGFGLVGFYGISTLVGYLMLNPLYTYILNIYNLVWFGFMAYQHYRLSNTKSSLYIYIKYIWLGLVAFYCISTIVGYLMPNPLYTYILIYRIWFGWVLWHINHCRLFNAKSSLYIYIIYDMIWFGWVLWHTTIVGYLMPNSLYIYIY